MSYMRYTVTLESAHCYSEKGGSNAIVETKLKEAILGVTKMITSDGGVSCGEDRLNGIGLVSVQRTPRHFCPELPKTAVSQICDQLESIKADEVQVKQTLKEAKDNLRWIAKRRKMLNASLQEHHMLEQKMKKLGIR